MLDRTSFYHGRRAHDYCCGNSIYGILEWPPSVVLSEMGYSLYLLHSVVLFVAYRLVLGEEASTLSPIEHWSIVLCLVPFLIVLCFATSSSH